MMKHIKIYESFINELKKENIKTDHITDSYINGDISLLEFNKHINDDVLNESKLGDMVNKGIDWALNKIAGMVLSISNSISKIGKKAFDILKNILKIISKFSKKYPTLFKVVVITTVVITLIIVSSQSAMAGSPGDVDTGIYDAAFYYLQSISDVRDMEEFEILSDAMNYIKHLKEGVEIEVNEEALNKATDTVKSMSKYLETAKSDLAEGEKGGMAYFNTMANIGNELMSKFNYIK